jgi:hypothetical protein
MANAIRETKVNMTQLVSENKKNSELINEVKTQLDSVLKENKVAEEDIEEFERKVKELEKSLTITIPKQQSFFSGSGYSLGGTLSLTKNTLDSIVADLKSPPHLVINQDTDPFDTKKYLIDYTHPTILKNDN